MLEGLGDVRLEVTDLTRSVAFYRDGLRFTPDADAPAEGRDVRLRAGDLRVVLAKARRRQGRPPRNGCAGLSVTVEVSGLDAYHDALVARGLAPSPPRDEGQRRTFTVVDPDGYLWRFSQSLA
ncbi:MAG: VOC family protein [Anaerolineae bacterium]